VWKKLRLDRKWLSAYHYAMASVDAERADDFFAQVASGEATFAGEPAHSLRERFVSNMASSESKQAKGPELIAWMVKAWNAAAVGQQITTKALTWRRSGRFAEPFPKVAGVLWLARDEELVS
jgi:hypothetical protein